MQTFIDPKSGKVYATTGVERHPLNGEEFLHFISIQDSDGRLRITPTARKQENVSLNGSYVPRYKGKHEIVTNIPTIS